MTYAPSEEYNIANHVKKILDGLIFRDTDDVDTAITVLSAALHSTDDSIPQQYDDVTRELQQLISEGFENYIHSPENSVLSRTYDDNEEKKPVYIPIDPSVTEEEKIIEAKREYQAIVVRLIKNKLNELKGLSHEERQAFVEAQLARQKSEIAQLLRQAGDSLDLSSRMIAVARRLEQMGDNLNRENNQRSNNRGLTIDDLNRLTRLYRRAMELYSLSIEFTGFQESFLTPIAVILSAMEVIAKPIVDEAEAQLRQLDVNDELPDQLTPR